MKPIEFKEQNVILAKDQPEYQPLPAQYNDDIEGKPFTSCWELDEAEVAQIAKTGRIYIKQLTFGKPFQPILPTIYNPFQVAEVPWYETEIGTVIACIPLNNGTIDNISALNLSALIEAIRSKHIGINTENICFVKTVMPDQDKSGIIIP